MDKQRRKKMEEQNKINVEEVQAEVNELNARFRRPAEMSVAMNIAKSREYFRWAFGYSALLTVGTLGFWAIKLRFPVPMLLPLSATYTYTLYEYDLGYGTKLNRLGMEAQNILKNERYKYFGRF
jgi:hypothetical protein